MLDQARALNLDIEFCKGNMLALPLGSGRLAGIAASDSIVNLPVAPLDRVFSEMERVFILEDCAGFRFTWAARWFARESCGASPYPWSFSSSRRRILHGGCERRRLQSRK